MDLDFLFKFNDKNALTQQNVVSPQKTKNLRSSR